ncbi:MAG: protein translocase subunit SecD [Gammaproteobacteria bacterium]|nr:protein translocase subunit SecD [Gammaproteobacteria bacterium]
MQRQYPIWKYVAFALILVFGIIYSVPNLFGDDPAVQISSPNTTALPADLSNQVKQILETGHLPYQSIKQEGDNLLIRFTNPDTQLKARDILKGTLNEQYVVALNLAPRTPKILQMFGAQPMKLGLDLRGGVHLLVHVDADSLVKTRLEGETHTFTNELRQDNIRYTSVNLDSLPDSTLAINIQFPDEKSLNEAYSSLPRKFSDYLITKKKEDGFVLRATLTEDAIKKITDFAVDQNMTILNNRVNELGVSEAVVQRQGRDHVSVDLPGVQDTARAKDLLGKTATLKFQMVETEHDASGSAPMGSKLYDYDGRPILLKNQVILSGSSITYATSAFGEDGRPNVQVRLGGGGESLFHRVTADNVGKPMAVVYVESKSNSKLINGKLVVVRHQVEKVINVATIQSALGNNFQITGLSSEKYAENLALLLRSGALTAPVDIAQEQTVGPSLGAANIEKGILSLVVGTSLVFLFMILYYRLFGLFADLALLLNVVFIVAILSLLGGTLTLPGIAGIVLTVGMSVDANVLINERIREELRNGMSPISSIRAGYERAFSTIVDANVTTLIVAVVLFALGSGSVKSFAVTLTIGLATSMVTAIYFTRSLVNFFYMNKKQVKRLSIGI